MCVLSCVRLFAAPWTVAGQAALSMGFSRQEYWLPLPPPGDLPWPRDWTHIPCVSCVGRQILYYCATWEAHCKYYAVSELLNLCCRHHGSHFLQNFSPLLSLFFLFKYVFSWQTSGHTIAFQIEKYVLCHRHCAVLYTDPKNNPEY